MKVHPAARTDLVKLETRQIRVIDHGRRALATAKTVGAVKDIRDQAQALQAYFKQRSDSFEKQNDAAEVKIRAERWIGEYLSRTVRAGNPQLSHDTTIGKLPEGISRDQSF